MISQIRSSDLFIKIFQHINEKIKLELIKYSKNLQNIVDIHHINYLLFSRRKILYEQNNKAKEIDLVDEHIYYEGGYNKSKRNGKGKEFDLYNRLIFEGEYLHGKRHGYGKEYLYDRLIFEGEYLNGKRHGKGKEYYDEVIDEDENDIIVKFEGEYLNGKKWNGKGYNENKRQVYELKNGKGYFKEYYYGTLIFEGEYVNGEKNGKGKEYDKEDGYLILEGEYKNDKIWTGTGTNCKMKK